MAGYSKQLAACVEEAMSRVASPTEAQVNGAEATCTEAVKQGFVRAAIARLKTARQ